MAALKFVILAIIASISSAFLPHTASRTWGHVATRQPMRIPPCFSTLTELDIESKLKEIVAEQLGVEQSSITSEANFSADLGADSLDTVELVMAFEEEFGIEIPDDAAETIQTFGDAVKFITEAS